MSVGTSHTSHAGSSEPGAPAIAARRRANALLAAILIPLGLLTVAGMLLLWPSGDTTEISVANPYATADGVVFETGTVQRAELADCPSSQPTVDAGGEALSCLVAFTVPDAGGPLAPVEVTPELAKASAVEPGDRIRYLNLDGVIQGGSAPYVSTPSSSSRWRGGADSGPCSGSSARCSSSPSSSCPASSRASPRCCSGSWARWRS
jgi:hypothetical protein